MYLIHINTNISCSYACYKCYWQTITLNICKEKQEWLDTIEDATTEDFIAQRIAFTDVVGPVVQKLLEPRE